MSMTALIILSAIVLLSCTILKRVSARIGVPTLLLFILLGMVFGSDGLVNIPFDDYAFAEKLSMVALAIIMFYGGFGTSWKAAKPVAVVSIVLSSLGTIATAAIVGLFCYAVLGMPLLEGMLCGALLSSTDGYGCAPFSSASAPAGSRSASTSPPQCPRKSSTAG